MRWVHLYFPVSSFFRILYSKIIKIGWLLLKSVELFKNKKAGEGGVLETLYYRTREVIDCRLNRDDIAHQVLRRLLRVTSMLLLLLLNLLY